MNAHHPRRSGAADVFAPGDRRPATRFLRRRGVILVLSLFSIFLVAGVFAFSLNTARQINRKVVAQHAADSAARTAAGFTARQFNIVAMNNVAMSRIIAVIPHLDAQPVAVDRTLKDQTAFRDAMNMHLSSLPGSISWVRGNLTEMRDELNTEIGVLEPVHDFFNRFDLEAYTHYSGGSGHFWQALEALDQYNQLALTELGVAAQTAGIEAGRANLMGEEMAYAFTLPVVNEPPWERGRFNDFNRPVNQGLLPPEVDHREFNRGPWDTVFGWRRLVRGAREGYWVPGEATERQVTSSDRGGVPHSRSTGRTVRSGGRFVTTGQEPNRYGVWGEYHQIERRIHSFHDRHLRLSRYRTYAHEVARIKNGYLWSNRPIRNYPDAGWILNIAEAFNLADEIALAREENRNPGVQIRETAWYNIEIKSRYPAGHAQFLSPGTWSTNTRRGQDNPRIIRVNGWDDPRGWAEADGVSQLSPTVWTDEFAYMVNFDRDLGLPLRQDGRAHLVYRVDVYLFLGIEAGGTQVISNPFAGFNRNAIESPAPSDIDHSRLLRDEDSRFRYLTYMGIARSSDFPVMIPDRFVGDKPDSRSDGTDGSVVAIAQAHVFNNHSWDLWTQMWSAQLQRFREQDLSDWVVRMYYDQEKLGLVPMLSPAEFDRMAVYLEQVFPMGSVMLRH